MSITVYTKTSTSFFLWRIETATKQRPRPTAEVSLKQCKCALSKQRWTGDRLSNVWRHLPQRQSNFALQIRNGSDRDINPACHVATSLTTMSSGRMTWKFGCAVTTQNRPQLLRDDLQCFCYSSVGTIDHCGRGARAKKAHSLYILSFKGYGVTNTRKPEERGVPVAKLKTTYSIRMSELIQDGLPFWNSVNLPSIGAT
jgi:hypothetical protein